MADYKDIAGRIRTTANDGVAVEAHEVFDINKNSKQNVINAETDNILAAHTSALNGIQGQQYVTLVAQDGDANIAAVFAHYTGLTPATDTVYRIANWKHDAVTKYNVNYYSEYAATGTNVADLVPISVENKGIDDVPTSGSENLVKSGGVADELALGAVYDVTAHNDGATFDSLSALLSSDHIGSLIPTAIRKGGMSIRFVLSSDNKYVQYRLMLSTFTAAQFTNATNWQGVTDELAFNSKNLPISDIVEKGFWVGEPDTVIDLSNYSEISYFISGETNKWVQTNNYKCKLVPVTGRNRYVVKNTDSAIIFYALLTTDSHTANTNASYATGCGLERLNIGEENNILAPADARYMFVSTYITPDVLHPSVAQYNKHDIRNIDNEPTPGSKNLVESGGICDTYGFYIDNPEYLFVVTDSTKKILFGYHKERGIEWFIGVPDVVKEFVANYVAEHIDLTNEDIEELKGLLGNYYLVEDAVEERKQIVIDEDNRLVSYRRKDGTLVENAGIETPTVKSEGIETKVIKAGNVEAGSLTVTGSIDLSEKAQKEIIGMMPEDVGTYKSPNLPAYGTTNLKTETFYLTAYEGVEDIDDVVCIRDFDDTAANAQQRMTINHYYVKSTLTDNGDGTYSINENSVRLQHYAAGKVKLNATDNKYYAKDPVRKVSGNCYYADTLGYTGAMGSNRNVVIEGYTREAPADAELAEGAVKQTEVEVVQITGPVCVNAWTVEDWDFNASLGADIGKKYEHNCIGDVDFGHYLSGTDMAIGVKHQGNSTQIYRKRNFRYTFYKNATFAKKDKKKIGEMIRLSKFNLKANWLDDSRLKEMILYRVFTEIWQNHRPITDRYNWDGGANGYYHGSTGNIKGFPIKFSVAGDFYGIYMFTIPKDGSNYLIDDKDEDTGLFVSGAHNTTNDWGITLPYVIADHYDSEMDSDMEDYPGIIAALEEWTHFINNRLYEGSDGNTYNSTQLTEVEGTMYVTSTLEDGEVVPTSVSAELIEFNKENGFKRLDVLGFIDYFICMQLFVMVDNGHNNMLMYAGAEKKKMFPFFYDLDGTMPNGETYGYNCDVITVSYSRDTSLWRNIRDIYWDDIVNRYCELRKSVLTYSYIEKVYKEISSNIPTSDYSSESSKWGGNYSASNFESKIAFIKQRLEYLDTNYFIV